MERLALVVLAVLLSVTCCSSQPVGAPAPVFAPSGEGPTAFPSAPTPEYAAPFQAPTPELAPMPEYASPPSLPSPPSPPSASSPSPTAGSPGPAMDTRSRDVMPNVTTDSSSDGLKAGQKAGIVVGVVVGAGLVGLGGLVYKKRQENIRRTQYGYAARREQL